VNIHLLDTNLLIALAWPQHVHHARAHAWFGRDGRAGWATCPLTQLGFIRISSNPKIIKEAVSPRDAAAILSKIIALPGHHFWPDIPSPAQSELFSSTTLVGHRQVTDAYLLTLTLHQKGKLATLDGGLSQLISSARDRDRHVTLIASD
jgi:uncharacterized protein